MPGVFINYRRQDSAGYAGRLCDRLQERLGRDRVFMDVTGVDPGVDFAQAIDRVLESCDLLLAVIGPDWLTCTDGKGQRRLDDPRDFVRLELAAALRRNVRVIPVLVGRASVPPAEALPDDLKPLSRRQTVELRDTRWDADSQSLIDTVTALLPAEGPVAGASRKRRIVGLVAAAVVTAAVSLLAGRYFLTSDPPPPPLPARHASIPTRELTYAVTTRSSSGQYPGSTEIRVAGDRIFARGDLVRFSFSSPQAGFLYLINESPADTHGAAALNILFPSPTSNGGSARLSADQDLRIPDTGEGFVFDAEAGAEKLWLVWSATRVDELDGLKRWANPTDRGEIKDARDSQRVRDFLLRHASPAPETREIAASARTVLTAPGDLFVKLVTLEHGR